MAVEIKVPSPGESITEVQIARWIKKSGDFVEKDEEIAEIDSDKATLTLAAESSGKLEILVPEGQLVAVGTVVASIDEKAVAPQAKKEVKKDVPPAVPLTSPTSAKAEPAYAQGHPSPAAKKIMEENGLSASSVKGEGRGGRITKADVLNTLSAAPVLDSVQTATTGERIERREKMSMLRKKVAQRLVSVKQSTAMLTTFNEVDMSAIMEIRKQYKDVFKEKHGVGLGFMSFFTRAVCMALEAFPNVNARIEGDEIVYHDFSDIGIAVSAPKGLMVPVVRNAERMSLAQIESEILRLATRARDGKLSLEEMSGGTFTITNGGVFGSMLSTPIINPPQSAILGMHNIVERPVAIQGKVEIRPVMYVALSYDHRIIDGKDSVGFLVRVKSLLEEPVRMLTRGNDPVKTLLALS